MATRLSHALAVGLLLALLSLARAAEPAPVTGSWLGTITVQAGIQLRVVFNIAAKPDGALAATLDSPDQGAKGIPMDSATFTDGTLKIEAAAIMGRFEGKLSADGKRITGKWTQAGQTFPLELTRTEQLPELRRPQEPKPPYPYLEEEVSYPNKAAGITLAGTLTMPRSGGPFPAVILITGSGPQDRDESLMGHKPFKVLADSLTRRGVAVLRVDDRGVGKSTGSLAEATTQDFVGDVLAGIAYLKTRREINQKYIGLIGHSEGGIVAPLVAVKSKNVAFLVLIAGTAFPGDQIIMRQAVDIARAQGMSPDAIKLVANHERRMLAAARQETSTAVAEKELTRLLDEFYANATPEQRALLGMNTTPTAEQTTAAIRSLLSPWMRHFLRYDPRPTLRKVRVPVLAIGGSKDLQVAAKENLAAIRQALRAGGNRRFTAVELPGLNHLLQPATTGAPSEYGTIETTMDPKALKLIGDWVVEVASPARR